jgi:hypothetical protein
MLNHSSSKTEELVERLRVLGVFARGISDSGGVVGFADIVFHDSPPLAGWALGAVLWIVRFWPWRVTPVTFAKVGAF